MLRYPVGINPSRKYRWEYYTGKQPTQRLHEAKIFGLDDARNQKHFGHTTRNHEIKRVTEKMLFTAALQGL